MRNRNRISRALPRQTSLLSMAFISEDSSSSKKTKLDSSPSARETISLDMVPVDRELDQMHGLELVWEKSVLVAPTDHQSSNARRQIQRRSSPLQRCPMTTLFPSLSIFHSGESGTTRQRKKIIHTEMSERRRRNSMICKFPPPVEWKKQRTLKTYSRKIERNLPILIVERRNVSAVEVRRRLADQ